MSRNIANVYVSIFSISIQFWSLVYIWMIYTTLHVSSSNILFNNNIIKIDKIYVSTNIPNINTWFVIWYRIDPLLGIILWVVVWANFCITIPEIEIIDKYHFYSIIVTRWFWWIIEVVSKTADTFLSMMNIRMIYSKFYVRFTIYIWIDHLFKNNMIKMDDIFVSNTLYILQLIRVFLYRKNIQHSMWSNPGIDNILIDNCKQ